MLDSDKLLHDLVEPETPKPTSRRISFTGRVSDVQDDTISLMYADEQQKQVTHPRDGVQRWQAGERTIYSHLREMQQWLNVNVGAYLRTIDDWQPEVYPHRMLYAHGMRGSGRLMLVADYCCANKINLLVAWRSTHAKDAFFAIYEKAAQMTPCVVYINNATNIFGTPAYTNEFIEAQNKCTKSLAQNVWTVLAGSYQPKGLLISSRHSAHPIYTKLLEPNGDIVNVPCLGTLPDATAIALDFVRDVARNPDIVPRDYRSSEWVTVIDHLARAFLFHTTIEMRRFVRSIFAEHNKRCAAQGAPLHEPTAVVFTAALQRLVRVETGGQIHYKLGVRNAYEDFLQQGEIWRSYTELIGSEPSIQCAYTPSILETHGSPSSISSPTRTIELLPQCAPDRRTTKRQREAAQSRDQTPSTKPLLTPKKEPLSPPTARSFFDNF